MSWGNLISRKEFETQNPGIWERSYRDGVISRAIGVAKINAKRDGINEHEAVEHAKQWVTDWLDNIPGTPEFMPWPPRKEDHDREDLF